MALPIEVHRLEYPKGFQKVLWEYESLSCEIFI